ncbi:type IV pilus modification protein PilV [Luteimonas sp. JM171]|uniref:type IV pilus modification protein PilV n=1 Tax=Luteimonas sp. JM171 TaxID=1896164 RepID=UPI000855B91A|nr:type IV pilus modification protein PilV [Luteimonas sp. JM171]AOH34984.1 type IV pilus modification protein PilV [Luteimonas sp. JM171]
MKAFPRRRSGTARGRAAGFSMIEVLVSLLVLALGLLGFALLQTMNLRYTQSADYRTHATNLAYDLLDQMRANRHVAHQYAGVTGADMEPGSVTDTVCSRPLGDAATVAGNIGRWKCQVARTLGPTASAGVQYVNNGDVTITIAWGDQRWDQVDPDATTAFRVETRL